MFFSGRTTKRGRVKPEQKEKKVARITNVFFPGREKSEPFELICINKHLNITRLFKLCILYGHNAAICCSENLFFWNNSLYIIMPTVFLIWKPSPRIMNNKSIGEEKF